jgi:hypothetical protein
MSRERVLLGVISWIVLFCHRRHTIHEITLNGTNRSVSQFPKLFSRQGDGNAQREAEIQP